MFSMENAFEDMAMEGYKEYQYIVEYENEDGGVETEVVSLYAPIK